MSSSNSFIKEKQKRSYRRKSPVSQQSSRKLKFTSIKNTIESETVEDTRKSSILDKDLMPLSQSSTLTSETNKSKILFKRKNTSVTYFNSTLTPSCQVKSFSSPVSVSEAKSEQNEEFELSYEIDNLFFNFLSEEEIEKLAVVEITDPKYTESVRGGLYDLRMGPLNNNDICETCEANYKDCQGHFGYINLAVKIPHPLRSKTIVEYLSLFCKNKKCHRLIIKEEKINLLEFNKYKNENRYKKILSEAYITKVCPYCETIIPKYSCIDDKYIFEIKNKKYPLRYEEIYNIFSNIRESDIELLGFSDASVHPVNLILQKLIVVPPCVRSFTKTDDGESRHDDLTVRYSEVIKTNNKLKFETKEKIIIDETDRLLFHIKTLMDNNKGKAKDNNGTRPIKCIKKRLSGKQGRIRQNIQGKRSEFCARTVIGADALCRVDELVMPEEVAKTLSYPVRVNSYNMDYCYKLLSDNKVNYIIRGDVMKSAKIVLWTQGFKLEKGDEVIRDGVYIDPERVKLIKGDFNIKPGDKVFRKGQIIHNVFEKLPKKKHYELQEGDILERQLQNGDLGVFNRQPTLWKGSMRAKKIKILPGKTFRFNLASTQAFNADFDGDEMNFWSSHSEQSRAECATILNTVNNFMSSQDSKPLLAIKQDAMTGGYVLTYGYKSIPKYVFNDVLSDIYSIEFIDKKINHIIEVYKWKGLYFSIKNTIKKNNDITLERLSHFSLTSSIQQQIDEINKDLDQQTVDYIVYNGHSLFSFLLPNDFEYSCQNNLSIDKLPVFVTRGVLLSGVLSKEAIGSVSGSLIHHIGKDYGYQRACDFLSDYQILINRWLIHHGFTISLEDCIPNNTTTIESEINKCFLEAFAVMKTENDPDLLEARVAEKLNKASGIGQKLAKDALKSSNNLVTVIKSGAKGSFFNVTQVTGIVGQQNVNGERIKKTFFGRTLPSYLKKGNLINDIDKLEDNVINEEVDALPHIQKLFESRGFVSHSYFKGLTPQEFFFHAAGGREGLIDTACKTAETGYIQRKMIKMVEDLKFNYSNNVTNSTNSIIDFMYGGDNLDASRLIKTNSGFSFIDINHISDKINSTIEFNKFNIPEEKSTECESDRDIVVF